MPPRPDSRWLAPALAAAVLLYGCATPGAPQEDSLAAASRIDDARFIVLAVINDPATANIRSGGTGRGYVAGSNYVVSDSARRALRTVANQYHLRSVAAWPITLLHLQCAVFAIPDDATRTELLTQLQQDGRVALAEPLRSYTLQGAVRAATTADPYASVQPGNERMSIAAAHRLSTGRGVRIALIDTGLDTSHPDLRGRVLAQRNFVDGDTVQFQRDRHGTAVAGVIAANAGNGAGIVGVAPEAQLLALKACWELQPGRDEAHCNSFTLAQALASAVEMKAQIINLSLTGPPDPLLAALAEQAIRKSIVIVGPGALTPSFPGGLTQVLGVARSEDRNVAANLLQAPGRDVLTLAPGGEYDFSSGSSISTGEISGIAALLLARNARLDTSHLHHLLDTASDSRDTASGPSRAVNACQAVASLVPGANCEAMAAR
ncbi:MAG: S8 family serine peptidase [Steroidobacteraceae bacterium]